MHSAKNGLLRFSIAVLIMVLAHQKSYALQEIGAEENTHSDTSQSNCGTVAYSRAKLESPLTVPPYVNRYWDYSREEYAYDIGRDFGMILAKFIDFNIRYCMYRYDKDMSRNYPDLVIASLASIGICYSLCCLYDIHKSK